MHPIIIWGVCVLFYLAIEQSGQVIISQSFRGCYWLPLRHVIIFTPAKTVQWINAPLVLGHARRNKRIKYCTICRLVLDLTEVTSTAWFLYMYLFFNISAFVILTLDLSLIAARTCAHASNTEEGTI